MNNDPHTSWKNPAVYGAYSGDELRTQWLQEGSRKAPCGWGLVATQKGCPICG